MTQPTEPTTTSNAGSLAAAYSKIFDARASLERAHDAFERELLASTAEDVESAREGLPEHLALGFSSTVRQVLSRRVGAQREQAPEPSAECILAMSPAAFLEHETLAARHL